VIENEKTLITKKKAGKFMPQRPLQPSRPKNIEVAHELSFPLQSGRKGSRMTPICTRSVEDTMKMQSLYIMMKSNLHRRYSIS
jgi:hypothetical protein